METIIDIIKTDFGSVIMNALIFLVSFLWRDLLLDIEYTYFPHSNGMMGRILYTYSELPDFMGCHTDQKKKN